MNFVRRADRQIEVLHAERDQARARVDYSVKLLTGIHSLLYPAPVTTADGRTKVFRPKDPDPHTILQELSDRIRALPDEIAGAGLVQIESMPLPRKVCALAPDAAVAAERERCAKLCEAVDCSGWDSESTSDAVARCAAAIRGAA
jgi:hypothetical protein